ncbi:MAG: peptide chain release factor 2 [Firmicutes bacterium]|nr:peptide chain release factor 2 [Bacillota bacterium]
MLLIDQLKMRAKAAAQKLSDTALALDIPTLIQKKAQLTTKQQDPNLYLNPSLAQKINTELARTQDTISYLDTITHSLKSYSEMLQIVDQDQDLDMILEIQSDLQKTEKSIDILYLSTLLKGEYDTHNAIISVHAGAGGTESCDWVSMLYRMYKMYGDKNRFKIEETDRLAGDEAGIKSVSFFVRGHNAYGFLKAEKGVHRLVRISPFDSNARRHTSFASVEVMPEIENDGAIKIAQDELKIDTFRSGGAGGQHVNKTESAIRITHLPTGIVVSCQNQRSQILNKEAAMKMLMGKLAEKKEQEQIKKAAGLKGEIKKIEWGSQIRNYVFQPYTMVKDLRTGCENTDVSKVMDGDIGEFIFEFLRKS